ncbi:MAG: serpin family protein [Gemmatimonadetes bacterium]|nr:serpin family protein [Gemmatimonadota bacterium]NIO31656.1 serpin family protein [Gemmatimonadota bacterium]
MLRGRDDEPDTRSDAGPAVQANNELALDLYGELRQKPGNLVFSPYSISTALAMACGGARGGTQAQMARTLHFSVAPEALHQAFAALQARVNAVQARGDVRLLVANALWPQERYAFLEDYLSLVKECYGAAITPVDYQRAADAARQTINDWVESKTEDKIKELIAPGALSDLTHLVLVNAIYFKGDWLAQFDPGLTSDRSFWLSPDKDVQVPMMVQEGEFGYAEPSGLQVLELPYVGGELSMVVLLPKNVRGLSSLEKALTVTNLSKWTDRLGQTEVEVYLPRFVMRFGCELSDALMGLGMTDAFDSRIADFSGMDGKEQWLFLSAVIHQAFIDVKEEGTEAAAATALDLLGAAPPDETPVTFRADHPFLFVVRENSTGSILFLGRVVNPTLTTV